MAVRDFLLFKSVDDQQIFRINFGTKDERHEDERIQNEQHTQNER